MSALGEAPPRVATQRPKPCHAAAGFPRHNITINPAKTRLNFPLGSPPSPQGSSLGTPPVPPGGNLWVAGDSASFVKWCGLLVNAQSLEVQADYTRYQGQRLITAISVPYHQVSLSGQ